MMKARRFVLRTSLFLAVVALTLPAPAARRDSRPGRTGFSAARRPSEPYLSARNRAYAAAEARMIRIDTPTAPTAEESKIPLDKLEVAKFPEWDARLDILAAYGKGRDARFLKDRLRPDFPRRPTWLYPDDGCYARAALLKQHLESWKLPVPAKLFIFGELELETPNYPGGKVNWWFHVVPAYRFKGEIVVMDPSVEARRPLRLREWIGRLTKDPSSVQVALCSPESYLPYSSCQPAPDSFEREEERSAVDDQLELLEPEWQRLLELGRDPEKELGDEPPWRSAFKVILRMFSPRSRGFEDLEVPEAGARPKEPYVFFDI